MTKEEVEQAFNGVSPYYAYKQGIQDGMAYNEESFRREAAKDILAGMMAHPRVTYGEITAESLCRNAILFADELIKQLKEK